MPRKNDEPTISHLTTTSGYLDLRKTIEGYRFFIKDHYYSDCSGFTASKEQLRQIYKDIGTYLEVNNEN